MDWYGMNNGYHPFHLNKSRPEKWRDERLNVGESWRNLMPERKKGFV